MYEARLLINFQMAAPKSKSIKLQEFYAHSDTVNTVSIGTYSSYVFCTGGDLIPFNSAVLLRLLESVLNTKFIQSSHLCSFFHYWRGSTPSEFIVLMRDPPVGDDCKVNVWKIGKHQPIMVCDVIVRSLMCESQSLTGHKTEVECVKFDGGFQKPEEVSSLFLCVSRFRIAYL